MSGVKKKISVIIPVYNVEHYLPKCIESVINQTYEWLEIILINDGSTDSCGLICDKYALEDPRILVINKVNGGQSSARNVGLDSATGFYIAFLDSDDWIDPGMYQTLVDLLEKYDADISSCGLKEIYHYTKYVESSSGAITIYDRIGAINSLVESTKSVRFEVWNKIYKREIIGNLRFKEKQIFEEVYFHQKIFLKLKSLVFVDLPFYNYLKVRQGNTNSSFSEIKLLLFDELDEFSEELNKHQMLDSAKRFEAYALYTSITLFNSASQLNSSKIITNKIKAQHAKYHKKAVDNPYVNKLKSRFFLNFPKIFYLVSKLKSQVSNLIKNSRCK